MKSPVRSNPSLMSKKYFSMLAGGTLTMMVASIMLMSDSFIAGAVIGSDAVAGITLVTPLYSLAVFFGSVISIGIPLLYSKEMGKFNKKRAAQSFGLGVLMSIIVGILLFVLIWLLGDFYLGSYSPTPGVLRQAQDYLFWMNFTILFLPIQMLIANMVYGDGDETVSTIATAVQGIGNIALSIVLSGIMGISGIGLASFIFNIVSILILLIHFLKKSNSLRWNLYFSFAIMKDVLRYSIIDSSSYLFLAIFTAALNAFISAQFGAEFLILASAITLCREFQLLFDGIGQAAGPIFSVYVGEQNHKGLRSSYSLANKTAVIEGIIVTIILVIIAPFAPQFLNVTNPMLAGWVVVGVRITAFGSTFISILYLLTSYYLVIEKITIGLVACALRDVVFSVGLAVALGMVLGIAGMFIGIAAAPAVAYALLLIYITARYGKKDCPLLFSKVPGDENSYLFHLSVEPEQIIGVQKEVETLLLEKNVDRRTVGKIKLLVEELYMLIREKNGDKKILSELTVFLHPEEIKIITKDDGVLFDISDDDVSVTSIASFAVAAYMEKLGENRLYLTTMSFNRSAFVIKTNK
jgi:Na+-driven multidrug efflux pump